MKRSWPHSYNFNPLFVLQWEISPSEFHSDNEQQFIYLPPSPVYIISLCSKMLVESRWCLLWKLTHSNPNKNNRTLQPCTYSGVIDKARKRASIHARSAQTGASRHLQSEESTLEQRAQLPLASSSPPQEMIAHTSLSALGLMPHTQQVSRRDWSRWWDSWPPAEGIKWGHSRSPTTPNPEVSRNHLDKASGHSLDKSQ